MMDSLKETLDTGETSCGFGALRLLLGASKAWTIQGFVSLHEQQDILLLKSICGQLFSRESKAGPSVRRQSMQEYQGISILFFSRQSKTRDQHLVFLKSKQSKCGQDKLDSKMVDKSVDQERENQCKAEIFKIKETSSAQCPVGLKGRRPHAPRGPTVPLQNNSEGASSRLRRVRSCVASSRLWSGQQN